MLQTDVFKDYAPNGLQVEGKAEIGKIVTSVTASKAAGGFAAAPHGGEVPGAGGGPFRRRQQ